MANANVAKLYVELVGLFEQTQVLLTQSAQIVGLADQGSSEVPGVADSRELHTPIDTPLSPEETLDSIITLLAACSFETQVNIVKTLALEMAKIARSRAEVKYPATA